MAKEKPKINIVDIDKLKQQQGSLSWCRTGVVLRTDLMEDAKAYLKRLDDEDSGVTDVWVVRDPGGKA